MYNLPDRDKAVWRWILAIAKGESLEPPHGTPGANLGGIIHLWRELGGKSGPHFRHSLRSLQTASKVKSVHAKVHGRVAISREEGQALVSAALKNWRYDEAKQNNTPFEIDDQPIENVPQLAKALNTIIFNGKNEDIYIIFEERQELGPANDIMEKMINKSESFVIGQPKEMILEGDIFGIGYPSIYQFYWFLRPFALQDPQKDKRCVCAIIVDIGHHEPTEINFEYFENTEKLATRLRSLAYFDWDDIIAFSTPLHAGENQSTAEMLKRARGKRPSEDAGIFWRGLNKNVCVIVKGWSDYIKRRDEIFGESSQDIDYMQDNGGVSEELRRIFGIVSAEHFLPRDAPREWGREPEGRRPLHEHGFRLMASVERDGRIRFYSLVLGRRSRIHAGAQHGESYKTPATIKEVVTSPGKPYERAVEIATWAARARLGLLSAEDQEIGNKAIVLLASHGFSALTVAEFVRVTQAKDPHTL